jgi:hypothetical protein
MRFGFSNESSSTKAPTRLDRLVMQDHEDGEWLLPRQAIRLVMMLLAFSSAAAIVVFAVLAVLRLNSYYGINHVSGSWMALTQYADADAGIYPPLYDSARQAYGGTRFMPETILLNLAASKITGEYLASGKLVALLCSLLLLALTLLVLKRLGCPTPISLALTSAILTTSAGFDSIFTIRGDALSVFWQLLAVTLVAGSQRPRPDARWTALAAILCVLAVLNKFSAVWGLIAILVWLLAKGQRRLLILFSGVFLVGLLGSFGALQILTHGRMLDNLLASSFAGVAGSLPPTRIQDLGWFVIEGTQAIWVLSPFALLGIVMAVRHKSEVNIYHLSFGCALAVTLVIYADSGAGPNHLLDMVVLTLILIGDFWRRVAPRARTLVAPQVILALLLLWVIPSAHAWNLAVRFRAAAYSTNHPNSTDRLLASQLLPDDLILSEDSTVPVSHGQRPVVLDPFMLTRIGVKHPGWVQDLRRRIESCDFDKVVLLFAIDDPTKRFWYATQHFGEQVVAAIRDKYRLATPAQGYYIYVPSRDC